MSVSTCKPASSELEPCLPPGRPWVQGPSTPSPEGGLCADLCHHCSGSAVPELHVKEVPSCHRCVVMSMVRVRRGFMYPFSQCRTSVGFFSLGLLGIKPRERSRLCLWVAGAPVSLGCVPRSQDSCASGFSTSRQPVLLSGSPGSPSSSPVLAPGAALSAIPLGFSDALLWVRVLLLPPRPHLCGAGSGLLPSFVGSSEVGRRCCMLWTQVLPDARVCTPSPACGWLLTATVLCKHKCDSKHARAMR